MLNSHVILEYHYKQAVEGNNVIVLIKLDYDTAADDTAAAGLRSRVWWVADQHMIIINRRRISELTLVTVLNEIFIEYQ